MMPRRATILWIGFWVIVAIAGAFWIKHRADRLIAAERERTKAILNTEIRNNEQELSQLEQNLKRDARAAEAGRRAQLEGAWGGPLAAAFKDPALSLSGALQRAADVCAPSNTLARVSVDRFTEFTITVDAPHALTTNEMIGVARKLLPVAKDYLEALRFSARGVLIAELDREDIRFVDDWSAATDRRIAMLLPREVPARVAQDPAAIERLRQEQLIGQALSADPALRAKTERADRAFRQMAHEAIEELRRALEAARKSVAFENATSHRQLDECEKHLSAAGEHAKRGQAFWSNPGVAWEKVLVNQGVEGDLRAILVDGFGGMFRHDSKKSVRLFEALGGELESCRFLLRTVTEHSGQWKFVGGGIAFLDDGLARQFERARRQWVDDAQSTDAALRAWNEAVGP